MIHQYVATTSRLILRRNHTMHVAFYIFYDFFCSRGARRCLKQNLACLQTEWQVSLSLSLLRFLLWLITYFCYYHFLFGYDKLVPLAV
jgi:hypothetical protein